MKTRHWSCGKAHVGRCHYCPTRLLLVASLIVLAGSACVAAGPEATSPPRAAAPVRPILYFGWEGSCGDGRQFTGAVTPDGKRVLWLPEVGLAAWAPDGTRFTGQVSHEGTHKLALIDQGGKVSRYLRDVTPRSVNYPLVWAPNGAWFVVLGREDLYVLADHGGIVARIPIPGIGPRDVLSYVPPETLRWSPDSQRILVAWEKTVVVTVASAAIETIAGGRVLAEWAPASDAVYYFLTNASPGLGATRLLDFRLHRLGTTEPVTLLNGGAVASLGLGGGRGLIAGRMSLSPSGARMAVVANTRDGAATIRIYDTRAAVPFDLARPLATFETPDLVTSIEWSPDERHLATMAVTGPVATVSVRLLDLGTGGWTTLASVGLPLQPPCIDLLGHKTLSWSR